MRRLVAVALAAFAVPAALAFFALCTSPGRTALDAASGDTPEARIGAYLDALRRGDASAAQAVWRLPERGYLAPGLAERRDAVTSELLASPPDSFALDDIQWWATCCEPGVIDDRRGAGGARARATLRFADGRSATYMFDVFARDTQPTWDGLPARDWVLREVYPATSSPLHFRWPPTHR